MPKAKKDTAPAVAVCPTCFPGGPPADAASVGCEHGTWVVDPNAPAAVTPLTADEKAAYEQRIAELEAQLAEAKAAAPAPETPPAPAQTPAQ